MLGPTKKGFQPINIPYYLWSKTGIIKAFYWPISYPQRVIGLKPETSKKAQQTGVLLMGIVAFLTSVMFRHTHSPNLGPKIKHETEKK